MPHWLILLGYATKTSKIIDFLYTTPPIMVRWQTPRAEEVSKIVLKVAKDDFDNNCKKLYLLYLLFVFTIFFTIRGVEHP